MKIIWASHLELTCFPSNQSLLNLRIGWIRAGPIHTHDTTHNKGNHCQLHCNRFLSSDQKIVGNSLQPIGIIITGNLFIKLHVEKHNICYWSVWLDHEAKNFPVFSDMVIIWKAHDGTISQNWNLLYEAVPSTQ